MRTKFLTLLLLVPFCANATPVNWSLEDVVIGTFINGNSSPTAGDTVSLTGTFTYDADVNVYSDVNISTSLGTGLICANPGALPPGTTCSGFFLAPMPGANYDYSYSASSNASALVALDSTKFFDGLVGDSLLYLQFADNLTNLGGEVGLGSGGIEYLCTEVTTCGFDDKASTFRFVRYTDSVDPITGDTIPYYGRVVSVAVPEPPTLALFGIVLGMFGLLRLSNCDAVSRLKKLLASTFVLMKWRLGVKPAGQS